MPMPKNKYLLIGLIALAGGSIPPFAKLALQTVDPFTLVFFRFLAASIVMYLFLPKEELSLKKFAELRWIAVIGAGNPIFIFLALQYIPSNITALFYALIPGMGAAYLWLSKKGRPTNIQLLGFFTGLIGVVAISISTLNTDVDNLWLGFLFAGLAVLSFFLYGILSKEKQRKHKISGVALAFYFAVITTVISLPIAITETVNQPWMHDIELGHIMAILYLGFVGTGAQYLLFQRALKTMEAAFANLFIYIQPVVGAVLAFILVGESVSAPLVVGGAITLVGARMALSKSKKS